MPPSSPAIASFISRSLRSKATAISSTTPSHSTSTSTSSIAKPNTFIHMHGNSNVTVQININGNGINQGSNSSSFLFNAKLQKPNHSKTRSFLTYSSSSPKSSPYKLILHSNYSTYIKKDKYGRTIQKRLTVKKDIASKRKTKQQQSCVEGELSNGNSSGSAQWPKLPKIITPTNVPLQPIQPLPNLSLSGLSSSTSNVLKSVVKQPITAMKIKTAPKNSTSTTTSTNSTATAASTPKSTTTGTSPSSIKSSASSSSSSSSQSSTNIPKISKEKKILSATPSLPTSKSKKISTWLKNNSGTIILNIGSIASLIGFTRTDMLELRMLSITGSCSTIYYFLSRPPPLVYGPIIWASIFLSTNLCMAYYVLEERKGTTRQFTTQEEDVYEEHFLPYGVTPRQYEKLLNKSTKVKLKRGEVLVQKDDTFHAVYLVTSGSTSGMNALSRRVTAASSERGNRDKLDGGDAGAWIGELAFLQFLGDMHSGAKRSIKSVINNIHEDEDQDEVTDAGSKVVNIIATTTANALDNHEDEHIQSHPKVHGKALLTYIANEDSTLYKWEFDDLANLLKTSTDLRLAVTRAMTAAVVNKVVNLYLSKNDADSNPTLWRRWMHSINETTEKIEQEGKEEKGTNAHDKRAVMSKKPGALRLNIVPPKDG